MEMFKYYKQAIDDQIKLLSLLIQSPEKEEKSKGYDFESKKYSQAS
jgi:hypothetical protein